MDVAYTALAKTSAAIGVTLREALANTVEATLRLTQPSSGLGHRTLTYSLPGVIDSLELG